MPPSPSENPEESIAVEPEVTILRALIDARGQFVSGSDLARQLGVSRVGIWGRLEKLRKDGFEFEAIRNRGYRLSREPDRLHPALIRTYLKREECDLALHFFDRIDSTNTEAERFLAQGEAVPFAVLAAEQSAGRGRLGRTWHSPDAGNFYLSWAFRPQLTPHDLSPFTLWMGLQVCELLRTETGLPIKLKWPNDIYIRNLKLAGMLTEARVDADRTRDLIFGLGLNVNVSGEGWPDEIRQRATSLRIESGQTFPANPLAAKLIARGISAYRQYEAGEFRDLMGDLWKAFDMLAGKSVEAEGRNGKFVGIASGIDDSGALLIRKADGSIQSVRAGEVTLNFDRGA